LHRTPTHSAPDAVSGSRPKARGLSAWLLPLSIFALAAGAAGYAASRAVTLIEEASETAVATALQEADLDWAGVDADGLNVFLIGRAPDEAERFRAVARASTVVDAARVVDQMDVREAVSLAPPTFSVEILRNEGGVHVIGLLPQDTDRGAVVDRLRGLDSTGAVSDLMETARHPAPDGWQAALDFGLDALAMLPRAKVSIGAGSVEVIGAAETMRDRARIMSELNRTRPDGLKIALDLSAPRPVITPFTLRFVKDAESAGGTARFDACAADTEADRMVIVTAARDAGLDGIATCALGLGVPSAYWADAARLGIDAVDDLGGGALTMLDAEITLVALAGTDQALFDRVVGELENALPDVFAFTARLPEPAEATDAGPVEFTATLSPEGQVVLRGRLGSEMSRTTTDSFARAAFGSDRVQMSARVAEGLPADWSIRVLAGLEALSRLANGAVTIQPEDVQLRGVSGNPDGRDEIARLLLEKLGQDARFTAEVRYDERLDPALAIPTPEQCLARLLEAKGDRKINFEPGSADLDAEGRNIMDDIATVLRECGEIPLEIQGHTDSQGSEGGNLRLSQERADTVLNELANRRVLSASFRAVGFGEGTPVADNATEEGRELNRRIEFALIVPEPQPEAIAGQGTDDGTRDSSEEALAQDTGTGAEEPGSE